MPPRESASRPSGRAPVRPGATTPASASAALDEVFTLAYAELKRLAATVRRRDAGATLTPTALVHEAWIKLSGNPGVAETSFVHFRRIAARAMRQVLVEAARRRHARKRGGAEAAFVTLDEGAVPDSGWAVDVLGLDEALESLARIAPRQARLVEARFFGGFEVAEAADLLGVSEATALRDWRAARAWLARELRRAH